MDHFGIGNAVKEMMITYIQSSRGTGRTTSLVKSLKGGDKVIVTNSKEGDRIKKLCSERGIGISYQVVDTKHPEDIFKQGTPKGRTIFDHTWVEQFYMQAIDWSQKQIDHLQIESSGFGEAHHETQRAVFEAGKWPR